MSSYDAVLHMQKVQQECLEKLVDNHADYVCKYKDYGSVNALSNICNRIYQLQTIKPLQVKLFNTQKLREYLTDIHNYSAMAIIDLDSKKNTPEPPQDKCKENIRAKYNFSPTNIRDLYLAFIA